MAATPSEVAAITPAAPALPEPEVTPIYRRGALVGVVRSIGGREVYQPLGDRCPACRGPGELVRTKPNLLLRHTNEADRHACRVASWKPGVRL